MNVKSPVKGTRLNNEYATPLTDDESDVKFQYLHSFCDWLDMWKSIENVGRGILTKETHSALRHTTYAMAELTSYCLSELKMNYILPGKFQTDNLEARFGQYRCLAGSNYNISLRQVYECEKKLRMMSVLRLHLPFHGQVVNLKSLQETEWAQMEKEHHKDALNISINVESVDIEKCKESMPVIVYLAGYCCYSVYRKMNCKFCKDIITCDEKALRKLPEHHQYISGISRGGLLHPAPCSVQLVMYNYIITNKLTQEPIFQKAYNQRTLVMEATYKALRDDETLLSTDICEDGHQSQKLEKMIIWASTNALLNNYCSKENNVLAVKKTIASGKSKRRKLETLCNK